MLPAWLQALQRPCQQWPAGKDPFGLSADSMSMSCVCHCSSCQCDPKFSTVLTNVDSAVPLRMEALTRAVSFKYADIIQLGASADQNEKEWLEY